MHFGHLALLGLSLSAGCATTEYYWEWKVTRSHNLDSVKGKTFIIIPMARDLGASPEYQAYAKMTVDRLTAYGLTQKPEKEFGSTDFVIGLDYGIGRASQTQINQTMVVQIASGSIRTITAPPSTGPVLSQAILTPPVNQLVDIEPKTITRYRQYVRLLINDGRVNAEGKRSRRYEGIADWEGFSNDLTKIVPSGLKALLTDFPGPSGGSNQINLSGLDQKP